MIQPNHFCDYSRRGETIVRFRDGIFHAAGTSLPVVFDPFQDEPLRWYTRPYGDVHGRVHENLRLIAVEGSDPVPPGTAYEDMGPLNTALHPRIVVEEYPLSEPVRQALRIGDEELDFEPEDWERVRCSIRTHDDCFITVQPVAPPLLRRLLLGVLRLHSFYLGQEIEWEPVLDDLTTLLQRAQWFKIHSNPKKRCTSIDWPRRGELVAWPVPEHLPAVRIDVRSSTATFSQFAMPE